MDNTPSVIGANEIYVDQRMKIKQQQQQQQQLAQMVIEGEKLSFKDKMRLFARQSGETVNGLSDTDNRLKVSRKQREIESKFDSKWNKLPIPETRLFSIFNFWVVTSGFLSWNVYYNEITLFGLRYS